MIPYIIALIMASLISLIPQSSRAEKAKTIDELVKMYDITRCIGCHRDKYEEWKDSTMGNSVVDPRVLRGWRTFIRLELDQEPTLSRKDLTICLNCHVPQIKDATPELVEHIAELVIMAVEDKDEGKREYARKELSKLNLNCLSCHHLRARGFEGEPEEGVLYGPREITSSPHEGIGFKTKRSALMSKSDFCAQCHHCPPSVPWEQCPTLYTSYVEGFLEKGRKETCQDCHMRDVDRSKKSGGWNHRFYGPDDIEFLKSAITLNVRARPTRYIDMYEGRFIPAVVLEVELTNNAGHVMPHG
jgi:hypothetical protein